MCYTSSPMMDISAVLMPLVDELHEAEPRARAFLLFGSYARGDAGPHSDLDLGIITAGPPTAHHHARFVDVGGRLLYINIDIQPYAELVRQAQSPSGWPWVAGMCATAQALDDPHDLLAALRLVVEIHRPAPAATVDGAALDLDALIQDLSKCKNARAAGDDLALYAAARHVAEWAVALLLPLNGVEPALGSRHVLARTAGFAVAPPWYREDLALCAGYTGAARPPDSVLTAAMRLAEGTVRILMDHAAELQLNSSLAGYLRDGTVLRYVRQRTAPESAGLQDVTGA